jgi:hypothetical protein
VLEFCGGHIKELDKKGDKKRLLYQIDGRNKEI